MQELSSKINFNSLYENYRKDIPWGYVWHEEEIAIFLENYISQIGFHILDVWCWYSRLAEFFIKQEKDYTGIDIAQIPIHYNKIYFDSPFAHFYQTDIENFVSKIPFSCIIDIGCLHCIESIKQNQILTHYLDLLESNWYLFLRYFMNWNIPPLFYIEDTPIYWVEESIIQWFIEKYNLHVLFTKLDTESFDLTTRKTLLLRKLS